MEDFRRLMNYKLTRFKGEGSAYKERFADAAVYFINNLSHTKGRWYGDPVELIVWLYQPVDCASLAVGLRAAILRIKRRSFASLTSGADHPRPLRHRPQV